MNAEQQGFLARHADFLAQTIESEKEGLAAHEVQVAKHKSVIASLTAKREALLAGLPENVKRDDRHPSELLI